MAGDFLSFEIIGGEETKKGLASIAERGENLSEFWRDIFAPEFFALVQDGFNLEGQTRSSGGRFGGGHWASLSPVYAEWKARHFPGARILERTGALKESLNWNGSGLGPGGVFEATNTYAVVGTSIRYGRYHQDGTSRMPARPFLPDPDMDYWGPKLAKWIESGEKG